MSDTTKYAELEDRHRFDETLNKCSCGAQPEPPGWLTELSPGEAYEEAFRGHMFAVRQTWMSSRGFVSPEVMWAICAYCGCIVGMLDIHRETCP